MAVVTSLGLFLLLEVEDIDDVERLEVCEALEDMDVNGARITDVDSVRDGLAGGGLFLCGAAGRNGDERVKSSVSTSSADRRSSVGTGIGAASITRAASRSFVGVSEARHASNVVCLDFPGDEATEVPRSALAAGAVFVARINASLVGSCKDEGRRGESTKSNVSIVSNGGGVFDRPSKVHVSAGSVCERCIGARLFLFVTLEGSSSSTGDRDFSRTR